MLNQIWVSRKNKFIISVHKQCKQINGNNINFNCNWQIKATDNNVTRAPMK